MDRDLGLEPTIFRLLKAKRKRFIILGKPSIVCCESKKETLCFQSIDKHKKIIHLMTPVRVLKIIVTNKKDPDT